ncbi:MAG TPA: YceI family protein [Bacteroidales bacterium]|nr:YceI family protein [Bacteroidales bacterium]
MKKSFILLMLLASFQMGFSQKLISKNSHIWFSATTPLENIEAHNKQAVSILDPTAGTLAFNVLIKGFEFKVALMQEHFNENYLESDKYPKSSFNGKINNNSEINYKKDGTYTADVSGDLTIHNVTKPVSTKGTIEVKNGTVTAKAQFTVKPADYNIIIPALVENKIAKEVTVNVEAPYQSN